MPKTKNTRAKGGLGKRKKKKAGVSQVEISRFQGDIRAFIDHFRSDVDRKKKDYQVYARKFQKKKA